MARKRGEPATDLTGQRFTRLVVEGFERADGKLRPYGKCWRCRCDCGAVVYLNAGELKRGVRKSCGCWLRAGEPGRKRQPKEDLTGRRFGRLVVEAQETRGDKAWRCRCDCGTVCYRARNQLVGTSTARTVSCGCYRDEVREESFAFLLVDEIAKIRRWRREEPWLTTQQIADLTGHSWQTVQKYAPKRKGPRSPVRRRLARVMRLLREGWSARAIVRELNLGVKPANLTKMVRWAIAEEAREYFEDVDKRLRNYEAVQTLTRRTPPWSAEAIAAELGISSRTVVRYRHTTPKKVTRGRWKIERFQHLDFEAVRAMFFDEGLSWSTIVERLDTLEDPKMVEAWFHSEADRRADPLRAAAQKHHKQDLCTS